MTTPRRIVLALFAALVLSAVVRADAPLPEGKPGVIFVVGGVGGVDPLQRWAQVALPLAGVPHEVRVFEWTHGKFRPLRDLQDTRYLQERAAELADQVRAVKAEDPSRPIFLIGHSAGAALVLETASQLPAGTIERMILLSAAVSPLYDLRPALRATRGEIVAFSSPLRRVHAPFRNQYVRHRGPLLHGRGGNAGLPGPRRPRRGGPLSVRPAAQSGWKPEMCLERRCWHNSTCMPLFLGRQVTPWLMPRPPDGVSAAP